MNKRSLQGVVVVAALAASIPPAFPQMGSEMKNFLRERVELNQDEIAAIQQGKPLARNVKPRSPAEIFLLGVIYVNAAPESYIKLESDINRVRQGPLYGAITKFSDSPQISDLRGFGFASEDVKALKECKTGDCSVQIPASTAMDELRKSVDWAAPNVDEEVNRSIQKMALSRLQQYQKEGNRIFGKVYNDKGQQVDVAAQFKYLLSYYQIFPQKLPELSRYIVEYPNAKPANVENNFYWEKMNFGLKPTLRIVHVLTMRGGTPGQPLYLIAEKQLYSSHYFETALDLTFLLRTGDPKQPGFYLVKTMGCEQAFLTGFKGSMTRRIAISHATSDMEKALASTKDILEHSK